MGLRGRLASNLQGLASNTIWRETIQFAGVRAGVEVKMRKRSRKINRSEVIDKMLGSATGHQTKKKKKQQNPPQKKQWVKAHNKMPSMR